MVTTSNVKMESDGVQAHFGLNALSTPPTAPDTEAVYFDDGTNTASGLPGWRYTANGGSSWADVAAVSGSGAPTDATYITQTANGTLSAEQALSSLTTGVMKVTNGTGVISTAVANTDYAAATHASRHITGSADEVDGDKLDIDWNPSNYTPSTTPTEADSVDNLTAHLYGIDQALAASGGVTSVVDNMNYVAGSNYTTTSDTWADVDATNVILTATLGGGEGIAMFRFFASHSTGNSIQFRISDGTNSSAAHILTPTRSDQEVTVMYAFSGISGSTTFKLQWQRGTAAGTGTIYNTIDSINGALWEAS